MDHQVVVPHNALWASYGAWGLMELWILSRDSRGFSGRRADRGSFLGFVVCIPTALIVAFNAAIHHPEWAIALAQPALFWIGVAMIWAGMAFRLWAVLTLGAFFRTSVVVQDEHRLITAGPYRWLRHPSYTGAMVTVVGLGLALGNWVSLAALAILPAIAIIWRIQVEERALAEKFGASYQAFRKSRRAVVPGVW